MYVRKIIYCTKKRIQRSAQSKMNILFSCRFTFWLYSFYIKIRKCSLSYFCYLLYWFYGECFVVAVMVYEKKFILPRGIYVNICFMLFKHILFNQSLIDKISYLFKRLSSAKRIVNLTSIGDIVITQAGQQGKLFERTAFVPERQVLQNQLEMRSSAPVSLILQLQRFSRVLCDIITTDNVVILITFQL